MARRVSSGYRMKRAKGLRTVQYVFLLMAAIPVIALVVACKGGPVPTDEITGTEVEAEGGHYYNIAAPHLKAMLEREDVLLINVSTTYDGEIEGTDLFIPYHRMPYYARNLAEDKDARVVLYCGDGRSSAVAAVALVSFGYTSVWSLEGGTEAWEEAGYTLVMKEH